MNYQTPKDTDLPSIYDLFFGQISHELKIKKGDIQSSVNKIKEKMGPIMLDVNNHSCLYEAWTASMLQVIEGYNVHNSASAASVYLSAQIG
jgi:hypothetical protein